MSEFTHVIESTGLEDAAVSAACPRELLGLACLVNEYSCLCEHVAESQIETIKNGNGSATAVKLSARLIPHVGEPRAVMTGLNMTGYRADFQASKDAVLATFIFRRPENAALALFVSQTGS